MAGLFVTLCNYLRSFAPPFFFSFSLTHCLLQTFTHAALYVGMCNKVVTTNKAKKRSRVERVVGLPSSCGQWTQWGPLRVSRPSFSALDRRTARRLSPRSREISKKVEPLGKEARSTSAGILGDRTCLTIVGSLKLGRCNNLCHVSCKRMDVPNLTSEPFFSSGEFAFYQHFLVGGAND